MSTSYYVHEDGCQEADFEEDPNNPWLHCSCGQHGPTLDGSDDECAASCPNEWLATETLPLSEEQVSAIYNLVGHDEWVKQAEKYAAWRAANPGKTLRQEFNEICDQLEKRRKAEGTDDP